jgi:hypothetical protein
VIVHTDKQSFLGDMVLCTVPLGVLKKGDIKFLPELPARKKDAIQGWGYGLLNKVVMLFPYDFWDGKIDTFGHLTEVSGQRGGFFLSQEDRCSLPLLLGSLLSSLRRFHQWKM